MTGETNKSTGNSSKKLEFFFSNSLLPGLDNRNKIPIYQSKELRHLFFEFKNDKRLFGNVIDFSFYFQPVGTTNRSQLYC